MNSTKYVLVGLLLLALLVVRFYTFSQNRKAFKDGQMVRLTARLLSEPEEKGKAQSFSLTPSGFDTVYVTTTLFPEYHYGQVLTLEGKIKLSEGQNGHVFVSLNYPKVLSVRGNDSLLYGLTGFIRSRVSSIYSRALPDTSASLLMGIVFGIKQGMPDEFKDNLKLVGLTHVVAASGMNVTMVAGALMFLLSGLFKRQVALAVSIAGILFYAALAGFEPSIVRASIMGIIVFSAGILGRQNVGLWTLGLTGYLMLLWNPSVLGDVGFQLSYLATLGILIIQPVMKLPQTSQRDKDELVIMTDLKTTLAAQLGTLPVMLTAFGQVSLVSVLANMLTLWTVPILMIIGSAAALIGLAFPVLGQLLSYLSLPFLLYFEWMVHFFGGFNLVWKVDGFSWLAWGTYYGVLGVIVWYLKKKQMSLRAKRSNLIE